MNVPFLDLKAGYFELKDELDQAYQRVMAHGHYIMGPELEAFEAEFAHYSNVKHCIGVGNGLEALHLSLRAMDIKAGDEVIVPAHTFVATWLGVSMCGATPVPVACDMRTYNLDPQKIEAAITPRTKAIIPVHLYGQPADMDAINAIAQRHGLRVLVDAAQSQGAMYKEKDASALADITATSFYPGKNLGCFGDGGAVMTDDDDLAARVRCLRNYGSKIKYHHIEKGVNARLDELQAAFLRVKLRHLNAWNARREIVAARYHEAFQNMPNLVAPYVLEGTKPVWHLYVVRLKNRDAVQARLAEHGIQTLIHYPIPPHEQECYAEMNLKDAFPEESRLAKELLSLPISPFMDDAQISAVIEAVQVCCAA